MITASFSGAAAEAATIAELDAVVGDRWLLCSDGLSDYVDASEIERIVRRRATPAEIARAAVDAALAADTRDNVTVVVCDVEARPSGGHGGRERGSRPFAAFAGAAADMFVEGLDSA